MSDTQPKPNGDLFKRIAAVMSDVRSLPKDGYNSQGRFNYVSSDKALEHVGKAMAEHGLVIIPTITHYESTDEPRQNNTRTRTRADFLMHICDTDGNGFIAPWVGEGIDYGNPDKALSKAITNATKYFLLKLFVVGAGGEDPDGESEPARAKNTTTRRTGSPTTPRTTTRTTPPSSNGKGTHGKKAQTPKSDQDENFYEDPDNVFEEKERQRRAADSPTKQALDATGKRFFAEKWPHMRDWLAEKYTQAHTPKNIRITIAALNDDEAEELAGFIRTNADAYKTAWAKRTAQPA